MAKDSLLKARMDLSRNNAIPPVHPASTSNLLRIVADDPATVNYGRAILEVSCRIDTLKFKIKTAKLVTTLIKSDQVKGDIYGTEKSYIRALRRMAIKYGPFDMFIAERFMPRGGTGLVGHGEAISMMLGLNVHILGKLSRNTGVDRCKLIPAVSWKTQIRRYFELKDLYKMVKPCPEHLLDAVMIGLYGAYTHFNLKPYNTLKTKDVAYIKNRLKGIGEIINVRVQAEKVAKKLQDKEDKLNGIVKKRKKRTRK